MQHIPIINCSFPKVTTQSIFEISENQQENTLPQKSRKPESSDLKKTKQRFPFSDNFDTKQNLVITNQISKWKICCH